LKGFKYIVNITLSLFVWQFTIFSQPGAYAEESLGDSLDCTNVSVDYLEDSSLTREERLRLMDKAFFQSLNKFELCQRANRMAAAAAAAAAGGGGEVRGESGAPGEKTGMSGVESVASSAMSGTETPQENIHADGGSGALQDSQDMAESGSKTDGNMQGSGGKLPEDIPPAQNDDALAAQIRYAAESETDPVKSKQLWNEYRKYKGLATK
jgi:hypothetical protein